jgi:hypothetical protein
MRTCTPMELKTAAQLIKLLDRIFSRYVRLKAADENGLCRCVSCGKYHNWKHKIQAGHFIPRTKHRTRFDETNVHPQCEYCNKWLSGNPGGYAEYMMKTYGVGHIEKLQLAARMPYQYDRFWLIEQIKHYREEVKRIAKEKGLEL